MRRRIVLTIDEVVLHGFEPHQRAAIGDALERSLRELFIAGPQVTFRTADIERIAAAPVAAAPSTASAGIGAAVAQRVFDGVSTAGSSQDRRP